MPTMKITKDEVNKAKPGARRTVLWDSGKECVRGFGLVVQPSGAMSYIFQYRIGGRAGALRRYTIGKHGSPWTPDQARARAKELRALVDQRIDPIDAERAADAAKAAEEEERRRMQQLTFAGYAEHWLAAGLEPATRPRTRDGYRATLANHITPSLGRKPLPEITKGDVVKVMDLIPANQPAVRRIAFAVMRMVFVWARGREDIEKSPLDGLKAPAAAASRDRVLKDDELALVLRAAETMEAPFGPWFQLLVATGQRRNEVAGLDWSELHKGTATWTLPAKRSKNGKPSIIALNRHALAAIDAMAGVTADAERQWPRKGLVFTTTGKSAISGFSRAKARLDDKMQELAVKDAATAGDEGATVEITAWRVHDLRRTLATAMQKLGIRFEVVEGMLNHTSGASQSGVAAVYQRHGWAPEKRQALNQWADYCDSIRTPATPANNVIPLRA